MEGWPALCPDQLYEAESLSAKPDRSVVLRNSHTQGAKRGADPVWTVRVDPLGYESVWIRPGENQNPKDIVKPGATSELEVATGETRSFERRENSRDVSTV